MGTPQSLRLAIGDLNKTFGEKYNAPKYLRLLDALEGRVRRGEDAEQTAAAFTALQREALLANPLLDFDRILLVRRPLRNAHTAAGGALGLPTLNARVNDTIKDPGTGWDDTLEELSGLRTSRELRTVYKTDQKRIICDVDLHFDGDRIMFSSGDAENRWGLYEFKGGDSTARLLTPDNVPDVSFYDSCYLPDGKIATTSTACYQGLPCQNGNQPMASLYLLDPKAKGPSRRIRQLTFEQDSDWCPTVMNDGRLLYLRWEYTDAPHYFTRVLFTSNPDGTGQMAYYGSNSYWPNAFFYARPIPDHRTRVIGIVGGHHGVPRAGKLMILDPAKGRHEADGVVQEIPWRGRKVKAVMVDRLVDGYWPQFLHPYPLSGKYHLVSMKKDPNALWGVYLVDVFDNMVLLKEQNGAALLEPIPYRKTKTPPVVAGRVDLTRKDATVYISNIYHMGSAIGALDERPLNTVTIDKPFAICTAETSNAAYALFDSKHDSRYIDPPGKNISGPGEPVNRPRQPVVRVTWHEAMAFCEWLGAKTGKKVTLPTEAQWEWACRAGTDTPVWYGDAKTDFSGIANLADKALTGKVNPIPKSSFTDGVKYSADVVFGKPNAWGLVDTHGNVAEWTRSTYRPYPYSASDGRNAPTAKGPRVVRGASWRDRPHRATSTYRLAYEPFQPVVNVGFRVIIEE